jgi:lipopolysaccharide assembly outer membrane protein LptD (OstA)
MSRIPFHIFLLTALFFSSLFSVPFSHSQTVTSPDTTKGSSKGVDTVVVYSAADSIIYSLSERVMILYGKGDIKYKTIELKSDRIDMNWDTSILNARGVPDTADTTGRKFKGSPILIDGGNQYNGSTISYDFKTQKGRITLGETEIEKGYYHGEDIKKVEPDVLFVKNGRYTTCDKSDPDYYFFSPKMKIITNDIVIAAPIFLYIGGVPVFALPFGVFPDHGGRRSGIVAPAYGDDVRRGRYLTHLGYYWAMSDYTDLKSTFDLYARGGWVAHSIFRYALRYEFSGSLSANFTNTYFGEESDPDRTEQREYNFHISHNQQFDPTTRADIDFTFTSVKYYQNTSTNLGDLLRQNVISNATLYKSWEGTNNSLSINIYRDQNLVDSTLFERLPSISFTRSQSFPFRRQQRSGSPSSGTEEFRWFELIGYSYNGQALNVISKQKVATGNPLNPTIMQRDDRQGVSHNISVNAAPKVGEFSITPFLNYSERWYNKSIRKTNYITSDGRDSVVTEDQHGFNAVRFYNLGVSANTRFYGIFPINALGIGSFRHTVTPSISYTYQPDFSKPRYGYWGNYLSSAGQLIPYSFYEREVFGGAPIGEVQSISLSVGHLFEMKTMVRDTSEKENKFQLLNLTTSISYNFAADSLRLSELGISYRTNVGDVLGISGASSFNFYRFDRDAHTRVNRFLISDGGGLAQLTSFSINLSTSLRGQKKTPASQPVVPIQQPLLPIQRPEEMGYYDEGQPDLSIPWNLSLAFDYSLNRSNPEVTTRFSNLRGSLSFDLTKNWKISASANYDLINKQIAAPVVNVYRDLHCWEMNFNWIPTGIYSGFRLEIRVKAPQLQDLKVTKQGSSRSVY